MTRPRAAVHWAGHSAQGGGLDPNLLRGAHAGTVPPSSGVHNVNCLRAARRVGTQRATMRADVFRTVLIALLLPALFTMALAGACLTCPMVAKDCCPMPDHCKVPAKKDCRAGGDDLSTVEQQAHFPLMAGDVAVLVRPVVPSPQTNGSDHLYTAPEYSPPDLCLLNSVLNI